MIQEAYLLLGSNEGNREAILREAIKNIAIACGAVTRTSSVYETAAWGLEDQPGFLNMVLSISTQLTPQELLAATRQIESAAGRQRTVKWGQRTLDIDILFYDDLIQDDPELHIPHPRMQDRRFTLEPLAEIAAGKMHPVLHKTIKELLDACTDPLTCTSLGPLTNDDKAPAQGTH